ncbi:hypothetical protein AB205_0018450 [Aquarana catesbeiana]|uniref:Uncharacterized protein n=1 Tax=Aquarana catesbeiana TaxID=8400 RepID=A0A2G9QCG7_AQUCT|nr:hypothetical protein AB205_0018450 [Aquarana catesbeiana]
MYFISSDSSLSMTSLSSRSINTFFFAFLSSVISVHAVCVKCILPVRVNAPVGGTSSSPSDILCSLLTALPLHGSHPPPDCLHGYLRSSIPHQPLPVLPPYSGALQSLPRAHCPAQLCCLPLPHQRSYREHAGHGEEMGGQQGRRLGLPVFFFHRQHGGVVQVGV